MKIITFDVLYAVYLVDKQQSFLVEPAASVIRIEKPALTTSNYIPYFRP
jgi:hypothetical protein